MTKTAKKLGYGIKGPGGKRVEFLDPDKPPSWLFDDSPDLCPRCLDCGVVVEEFNDAGEYCSFFGVKPEDLDRIEHVALGRDKPYRVARPCDCMKNRALEQRFKTAVGNVTSARGAACFEGVQLHVPYKVAALGAARAFVDRVVAGGGGVLIFEGETGLGKTYVGLAALRAVIEAGYSARYIRSAELCDDLRERAVDIRELRAYRERLKKKDAVFIDDFGWDRPGAVGGTVLDQYAELLRSYEDGGGLIIATNRQGDLKATGFELAMRDVFGDRADMITRRLAEIQVAPAVVFGGVQERMGYERAGGGGR